MWRSIETVFITTDYHECDKYSMYTTTTAALINVTGPTSFDQILLGYYIKKLWKSFYKIKESLSNIWAGVPQIDFKLGRCIAGDPTMCLLCIMCSLDAPGVW